MDIAGLISVHKIGGSTALRSSITGAVVLTNAFGTRILSGMRKGQSPETIAQDIAKAPEERKEATHAIRSVLQSWEQAGLLKCDKPVFPDPVSYEACIGHPLRFGGLGGTGRIFIPNDTLAEQVTTILGHMTPKEQQNEVTLCAQDTADGFAIFKEGQALSGRISLDAARFVILREMAEITCGAPTVAAVFHAGCVAKGGHALMICGDSGQGKSTLTFGLVAAGCEYLGDDHIPLHRDGKSALSFPTAAGVKPGSWALPEILQLQSRYGLTPLNPRVGVRYIPLHLARAAEVGDKRPLAAIVFPHYHPDATFKVERLAPEQALIQALQAGSRVSHSHNNDLAPLCEFLNDVPAYALHFSSSDQSVPACLNLLSSTEI